VVFDRNLDVVTGAIKEDSSFS